MAEKKTGIETLLTDDEQAELYRLAGKDKGAGLDTAPAPAAQDLPYKVIPSPQSIWIHPYSTYADLFKDTTAAARELHLACFLAAMSQAIGSRVFIRYSRPVGVNLYVLITGPSGIGVKGSPTYWIVKLLTELSPDVAILYEVQSIEYFNLVLAEKENRHVLVCLEETSSLLAAAQRPGTHNIMPGFIRLRDLPATFSTGTKNAKEAKQPYVSLLAASAWEAIEKYLTEGALTSGFINRCLTFSVEPARLLPLPKDPPEKAWNAFVKEIKQTLRRLGPGRVEIALSPEAEPYWIEQFNRWQDQHASIHYESRLITSRTHLHALELAAINAILTGRKHIDPEDIRWGWTLATYCQEVSLNTFTNWASSEIGRMELRLRAALKHGPKPKRELQQHISRGGRTHIWNQVIKEMKEAGDLNEFKQATPGGREMTYLALVST